MTLQLLQTLELVVGKRYLRNPKKISRKSPSETTKVTTM
ncbi:MAG: hypothetical protein QOC96_1569 [Acidobacteriota bacterium]|jgi:hypothetical protein|nr:hypothetical protein [Acidobacteriota bacterium]